MLVVGLLSALTFIAAVMLFISKFAKGGRRVSAQAAATVLGLPSVTALVLVAFSSGSSTSTALSVVGVVASFVFGFGGNALSINPSRRPKVGIVIASKEPFHQEIRRALYAELRGCSATILDEGGGPSAAREDLVAFSDLFRRAAQASVDYLVVWAPGGAADMDEVADGAAQLFSRGGLCIFLETSPNQAGLLGKYALIRHDAAKSATLTVKAVGQLATPDSELLLLLGPSFSLPAQRRNEVLTLAYPETALCRHQQLTSWSSADALESVRQVVKLHGVPGVISCPNDAIALALTDAIYFVKELRRLQSSCIIGHDGLPRALASVGEQLSPFKLTITIPPSEYGASAGRLIRELSRVSFRPGRRLKQRAVTKQLHIDDLNVINPARARKLLYDEDF